MKKFFNRNEMAPEILSDFLEKTIYSGPAALNVDKTDQLQGIPPPPFQVDYDRTKKIIDLPAPEDIKVDAVDLREAIERRISHRDYADKPLTLEELTWLLWATQGVKEVTRRPATLRTVPSSGCRHPIETYLLVNHVEGLKPGIYRYLAIEHKLLELNVEKGISEKLTPFVISQKVFPAREADTIAVVFIWALVPYRMFWRYGAGGCRDLFIDTGHVGQNLYLAAEAIGCGVCGITDFRDEGANRTLGIDGKKQLVVYTATVGKKK